MAASAFYFNIMSKSYKTLSEQFIEESYKRRLRNGAKKVGDKAKKAGKSIGDFAKKVFWDTDDRKYHDR